MPKKEELERLELHGFTVQAPDTLPGLICDQCDRPTVWARQGQFTFTELYCEQHKQEFDAKHPPREWDDHFWENLNQLLDESQAELLNQLQGRQFSDYNELSAAIKALPHLNPYAENALPKNYRDGTVEWGLANERIRSTGDGFGPMVQ